MSIGNEMDAIQIYKEGSFTPSLPHITVILMAPQGLSEETDPKAWVTAQGYCYSVIHNEKIIQTPFSLLSYATSSLLMERCLLM